MSGSGTNALKIIEYQLDNSDCQYQVELIFSDNPDSNAKKIGQKYNIPVEIFDIEKFYQKNKELKRYSLKDREKYDKKVAQILLKYDIDVLAYAGYMNITTPPIIKEFLGINVHPADLSIKNKQGERKYTGDDSVGDAIKAGEEKIASTTHIITAGVDEGPILMISKPIKVTFPEKNGKITKEVIDFNQERLKEMGDWIIFPKSLELIAKGLIKKDNQGNLYYKNKPIPQGIKL